MTPARVALRGLVYYRRSAVASALGIAVAAAVITGSLIAGGSVTATARRATLGRLGRITHAVVSTRPLAARIADALSGTDGVRRAVPALLYEATARNPDTDAAAPRVTVVGAPDAFLRFYPDSAAVTLSGREALVSQALAEDLNLKVGDGLVVGMARPDRLHSDSLFARRKLAERMRSFRLNCAAIVPQDGLGGFSLYAETGARRTVFVAYDWLADQMEHEGRASVVLVEGGPDLDGGMPAKRLNESIEADDLGLKIEASDDAVVVRSQSVTLPPGQVAGWEAAASDVDARFERGSIMLAARVVADPPPGAHDRPASAHYAVIGSSPRVPVADDEIVLSRWMAEDIGGVSGRGVTVEWMEPLEDGTYPLRRIGLRVGRIVSTEAAVAEKWIVPDFAGITDAKRISDWDPPFPVDLRLISERDERFWELHQAAPRAFVSERVMRRMWRADRGSAEWVTTIRLRPKEGGTVEALAGSLKRAMRTSPAILRGGPTIRDLRAEALLAAQGSSDFRGLMLGMSLFIVVSALGLSAAMMRLSAERRASQIGLMLAVGFPQSRAAGVAALEGAAASALGAIVGALAGIPLAGVYVGALNTWWSGAVARQTIFLSVSFGDVMIGGLSAALLGSAAAWWTCRRLARREALVLLAGWRALQIERQGARGQRREARGERQEARGERQEARGERQEARGVGAYQPPAKALIEGSSTSRGWFAPSSRAKNQEARGGDRASSSSKTAAYLPWLALAVLSAAVAASKGAGAEAFLAAGAGLLAAGLGALHATLKTAFRSGGLPSVGRIAARNAALHRGHSTLVAGMVAAAAFLLVTVAVNVRSTSSLNVRDVRSGAGGFDLIARSTTPLAISFDTPEGRRNLGFNPADEPALRDAEIVPLWLSGGVDTGCLNLARPTEPRIVGATDRLIERNAFTVQTARRGLENPWETLREPSEGGVIPAFGDAESVHWILKSGLGKTVARTTPQGLFTLRFDGLVTFSIFAGELLVSEESFRAMFPDVTGPSLFLVRAARPEARKAAADALRRNLGDAGLEVRSTEEALAELLAVQNTYLAAFLMLGGLGILLGTAGLGAVMTRTAAERRAEFALMVALGFRRSHLLRMMIQEAGALLIMGALLGTATALLASLPRITAGEASVNRWALAAMLTGIVAVGMGSVVAAAMFATRGDLSAGLRSE